MCDRITSTVLWGASGNGRPCRDFKIRFGFYLEDVSLVTDGILLDQPTVRGGGYRTVFDGAARSNLKITQQDLAGAYGSEPDE